MLNKGHGIIRHCNFFQPGNPEPEEIPRWSLGCCSWGCRVDEITSTCPDVHWLWLWACGKKAESKNLDGKWMIALFPLTPDSIYFHWSVSSKTHRNCAFSYHIMVAPIFRNTVCIHLYFKLTAVMGLSIQWMKCIYYYTTNLFSMIFIKDFNIVSLCNSKCFVYFK